MISVGIIGPEDLVQRVLAVGTANHPATLVPLPYRHETEAVQLVEQVHEKVDAILFTGVVPFTIEGMHPHDIAELCDREAVCVRAGHHCAQPLMRCLGVGATSRASFGVHNTHEDVDALIAGLAKVQEVFA